MDGSDRVTFEDVEISRSGVYLPHCRVGTKVAWLPPRWLLPGDDHRTGGRPGAARPRAGRRAQARAPLALPLGRGSFPRSLGCYAKLPGEPRHRDAGLERASTSATPPSATPPSASESGTSSRRFRAISMESRRRPWRAAATSTSHAIPPHQRSVAPKPARSACMVEKLATLCGLTPVRRKYDVRSCAGRTRK